MKTAHLCNRICRTHGRDRTRATAARALFINNKRNEAANFPCRGSEQYKNNAIESRVYTKRCRFLILISFLFSFRAGGERWRLIGAIIVKGLLMLTRRGRVSARTSAPHLLTARIRGRQIQLPVGGATGTSRHALCIRVSGHLGVGNALFLFVFPSLCAVCVS